MKKQRINTVGVNHFLGEMLTPGFVRREIDRAFVKKDEIKSITYKEQIELNHMRYIIDSAWHKEFGDKVKVQFSKIERKDDEIVYTIKLNLSQ